METIYLELNQKLDIIIELLEKLVRPPIVSSDIYINRATNKETMLEDNQLNIQDKELIEFLNGLTTRIMRANSVPKEFINKEELKIKVYCKSVDDKVHILEGTIQEDGSIVCESITENRTVISWGLSPKLNIFKDVAVFKQQVGTNIFTYVGTIRDNILTLAEPATDKVVTKPSTYYVDWFVRNTNPSVGCEWINVYPDNLINQILIHDKQGSQVVTTGYLTDDGRAIYYLASSMSYDTYP